ncbi:MAG: hypothetical protein PHF40_01530 [Candidatus Pacebacteria bacterium]|nr:hypothetical protein [Candidatus Paceibacterota bacterium]HOL54058.1 hypothetical protein [Candidatus Paceibacterota bacterium]
MNFKPHTAVVQYQRYGILFFMQPKVRFQLNKELDKKMALEFVSFHRGGIDFAKNIIALHPLLKILTKLNQGQKRKVINDYFDIYYQQHREILQKCVTAFNYEWRRVEKAFLREAAKIFHHYPFPKGKYLGYLSIINCNPRFLSNKTFQIYYRHPQGVVYVTMHELLHFIFYDYAIQQHPQIFKKLDPENGIFWDLSEIFNDVILSLPPFKKLHKQQKIICYPEHQQYFQKFQKLWQQTNDIDQWLVEGLEILKESFCEIH